MDRNDLLGITRICSLLFHFLLTKRYCNLNSLFSIPRDHCECQPITGDSCGKFSFEGEHQVHLQCL